MDRCFRFEHFELRPAQRAVFANGVACALGARAFDVLLLLIERRAGVVSREEVMQVVWAGLVVEDHNLTVQISALRKLLGAQAIVTVANRGYQFALPVIETEVAATPTPPPWTGLREAPVLLTARVAKADAHRPWFTEATKILLPSYRGRVLAQAPGVVAAAFDTTRSALACARHLQGSSNVPADLRLALCSADELSGRSTIDADGRPDAVIAALLERATSREAALSARIAGRAVPDLDGDIEAAGDRLSRGSASGGVADAPVFMMPPPSPREAVPSSHDPLLAGGRAMIAVLPFRSYAMAADGIDLGDVLADQLISLLAHGADMHVISRLSTAAFRERPCSLEDVARHLRAQYVVSGRYFESQGRITVDVEMADASRQSVLWKHTATDDTTAILHRDSLLTLDLVSGITQAVFAAEIERAPALAMPTLATHSLLLTAIGLTYRLSPAEFHRAKQALDALHERVPTHATPLAWLSRWHLFRVVQGWTANREQDGRLADDYARRSLDIEPASALALTMLGNARTNFHRDPAGGEALYDQALAINPNESLAWLHKGNALSFRGEGARAMEHIEKALSLSPLDPSRHFYQSLYASAALSAGAYEKAVTAAQASLRLNREHVSTYRVLAIALSILGRTDEARRAVSVVRRLEPTLTVKAFVARSPGRVSGLAQRFGEALEAAGLPAGD